METEPPERIWTCNETLNIWIPEKQEDTVEYVRSDIVAALRAELATARNDGIEAAAAWHDDMEAQHAAAHEHVESDHHMMMERQHRRDAAAIRSLKGETV